MHHLARLESPGFADLSAFPSALQKAPPAGGGGHKEGEPPRSVGKATFGGEGKAGSQGAAPVLSLQAAGPQPTHLSVGECRSRRTCPLVSRVSTNQTAANANDIPLSFLRLRSSLA